MSREIPSSGMRRQGAILVASLLALSAAATAGHAGVGDGSLVVTAANGRLALSGRGLLFGHLDRGSITIVGDYRPDDAPDSDPRPVLPEAPLVRELGGTVVLIPVAPGRSSRSCRRRACRPPSARSSDHPTWGRDRRDACDRPCKSRAKCADRRPTGSRLVWHPAARELPGRRECGIDEVHPGAYSARVDRSFADRDGAPRTVPWPRA